VRDRLRAAWQVLAMADRDHPDTLDSVLGHPYLRVWAVRCLNRLGLAGADASSGEDHGLAADLGHLGAIAAAVAILGWTRVRLTVPLIDGAVHLPGLGRLVVPETDGPETAGTETDDGAQAVLDIDADLVRLSVGADSWRLPRPRLLAGDACLAEPCTPEGALVADRRSAAWEPVRTLTAEGIRVALEDTDPYRDCHQWPAAPRLSDEEFARWQRSFAVAWQEIMAHHAAHAPELAVGLTAVMPMVPAPDGSDVSAAARQGYGVVGVALPDDPVTLALLLIHEFQHVKLGAVLDLYDLFDPADKRLYHAPWRTDPRPLEGLLQGTYAHLAVSDFWRVRAGLGGDNRDEAAKRYAHWQAHTAAAVETLADSGSLTPLGLRFAYAMRAAIAVGAKHT
jgi:uncharacterized protein